MEKAVAINNNQLIKEILERLTNIENTLGFINQYIVSKKAREDARWW